MNKENVAKKACCEPQERETIISVSNEMKLLPNSLK